MNKFKVTITEDEFAMILCGLIISVQKLTNLDQENQTDKFAEEANKHKELINKIAGKTDIHVSRETIKTVIYD